MRKLLGIAEQHYMHLQIICAVALNYQKASFDTCAQFGLILLTSPNLPVGSPDTSLALIASEMARVDEIISSRLSSQVPLVSQIAKYIISAGGKRVRPALLLLTSGALGYQDAPKYHLAAIVEFIHTATLLHDDVVDESKMRRGRPTANESFGNAASVLVGDFLYSRAFQMMVECNSMRVMSILSEATNVIAEGEVMQLTNIRDASLDEASYLRVIRSKTAKLFEASSRLGAVVAESSTDIEQACATYGQALGTAFQLIDDSLDYHGVSACMGKNTGADLREGKVTLPLIVAMKRASVQDAAVIREAIEGYGASKELLPVNADEFDEKLQSVLRIIRSTDAIEATYAAASHESRRAIEAITILPESSFKHALIALSQQAVARVS